MPTFFANAACVRCCASLKFLSLTANRCEDIVTRLVSVGQDELFASLNLPLQLPHDEKEAKISLAVNRSKTGSEDVLVE